ncbi:MAG: DNA polymerase III subunit gamma/tau [Acidimicrobiales bacterium]
MPRPRPTPTAQTEQVRPFQSLYRRFRPQRFAEVRGQDHVTRALVNAVRDGHVAHAYLFSGPRGTGKTSTARILAKALNCATPDGGEPCGTCESCESITAGSSFDVHELDAASNNGVDAMRDLVARASLATPGRWKVYIVDEVHMLSPAASNTLLKTLEEPPDRVVFVLATTDPQKVLPTLRSRTQHYEFHLIDEDELSSLVAGIADVAGIHLAGNVLPSIVRRARGSARDALSVLDQVAAGGTAYDDSGALAALVSALAEGDVAGALVALDGAVRQGRDPAQFAVEIVERLRRDFLVLVGAAAVGGTPGTQGDSAEVVTALGTARCVRVMELVGGAIVAMRDAPEPRITLEVALIRAARPEADALPEAVFDRVERLERRLEAFGSTPTVQAAAPPAPPVAPASEPEVTTPTRVRPELPATRRPPEPPRAPEPSPAREGRHEPRPDSGAGPTGTDSDERPDAPNRDDLVTAWADDILPKLRPKVRAIYQAGRFLGTQGPDALLALPNEAHILHAEPLRVEVVEALSRHFGRPVGLRLVAEASTAARAPAGLPTRPGRRIAGTVESAVRDEDLVDELAADADPEPGQTPEGRPPSSTDLIEGRLLEAFPGAEEV